VSDGGDRSRPVAGDTASRGGSVTASVGWRSINAAKIHSHGTNLMEAGNYIQNIQNGRIR